MDTLHLPQATSPLATWLYYLEHLHTQTIELGLDRIRCVAQRLDLLKPAPFVFTVAGTKTFRLGGHWEQDYVMVRPA